MKLTLIESIIIIIYCVAKTEEIFLTEDEENILKDLILHFEAKKVILAGENDNIKISIFKKISMSKTYVSYMKENEIASHVFRTEYDKSSTLIVYKVSINALNKSIIHYNKNLFGINPFIWLMFIDGLVVAPSETFQFLIPYEFYIIYPFDFDKYKIQKMYHVGNNKIVNDYGVWSRGGYKFLKIPKYPNEKTNMNQTDLIVGSFYCTEDMEKMYTSVGLQNTVCLLSAHFRDVIKTMNFRYTEIYKPNTHNLESFSDFDAVGESMSLYRGEHVPKNFIKYWPKSNLILLIKYPGTKIVNDFYIRPFRTPIWISILSVIIFGGFFCVVMRYVEKLITKSEINFNIADYFLIPYEYLLSQGQEYDSNISFRICLLVFRLFAIFIVIFYSSNIIAHLSVKILKLPFKNIEELVETSPYKMMLVETDVSSVYFYHIMNEKLRKLIIPRRVEFIRNGDEFHKKLCSNDKFAFPIQADHYFRFSCKLLVIPQSITQVYPTMWMNDESPYAAVINHIFLKARISGLKSRIFKMSKASMRDQLITKEEIHMQPIELTQLSQVYSILGLGMSIALIFFTCEWFIKFLGNFRRKYSRNPRV